MRRSFNNGQLKIRTATCAEELIVMIAITGALALTPYLRVGDGHPNIRAHLFLLVALLFAVCTVAFVLYHSGEWILDGDGIVWKPFLRPRQTLRWAQVSEIRRPKDKVRIVVGLSREIRIAGRVLSWGDMVAIDLFVAHYWPTPPEEPTGASPIPRGNASDAKARKLHTVPRGHSGNAKAHFRRTFSKRDIFTLQDSSEYAGKSGQRAAIVTVIYVLLIPCVVSVVGALVGAFLDGPYLSWGGTNMMTQTGLVGMVLAFPLFPGVCRGFDIRWRALTMCAVLLLIFSFFGHSLAILINGVFDHSASVTRTASVLEKRQVPVETIYGYESLQDAYEVRARLGDDPDEIINFRITKAEYRTVRPGVSTVTITLHKGALGYTWLASHHINTPGTRRNHAAAAP